MDIISIVKEMAVPRPNHSEALAGTAQFIKELLASWGVPFSVQEFPLRPYIMVILAVTILLLSALFVLALWKKRPVAAVLLALAVPAVLILEVELFTPVVSWIVQKPGENIIVKFSPLRAEREIIFSAHYDSKSDFWDHLERARVYQFIPASIALSLLLAGAAFVLRRREKSGGGGPRIAVLGLAGLYFGYTVMVSLAFGGFVLLPAGRESWGAVDDAGSVASLLVLAKEIKEKRVNIGDSAVTILLTAGEEVNLQGAGRYVEEYITGKTDSPAPPRFLVNLELAGQGGNLFYAKRTGLFLKFYPASKELAERIGRVWQKAAGKDMDTEEKSGDDSIRFMAAGIPSITIGHNGVPGLGMGDFHCEKDNMDRIDPANLSLTVKVLAGIIDSYR